MTREDAKDLATDHDGFIILETEQLIDKIYDDHETQLKKIVVLLFWQWRYFRNSEYRDTFVDARAKVLFYKIYSLFKGKEYHDS